MNIKLRVTLKECEGALLRLLGTIERRGHRLVHLSSRQHSNAELSRNLSLDVDCRDRSPDVLLRQIRRLFDVLEASWYECPQFEADGARLNYEATAPAMYGLLVRRSEKEQPTAEIEGRVAHG